MSDLQIRRFRDEDGDTVRELFSLGMNEHLPSTFVHILKQPLTQMLLACTFCALMTSSKSFLLPVLAITLLLAAARLAIVHAFNKYIDATVRADLKDVGEAYLRQKDSCFWVAELEGRVVGTVACLPAERAPGCVELKRMSVRRSHRGRGIARALCRTVEAFARERGFAAVVLHTSMVATDAQRLYERAGYQRLGEFVLPEFFAKLINFTLIEYRLDLQADRKND